MNINCKVQILSLWDLWSCWYRLVSVGNTVFSSRQSPFIIFHWSLVTLRTFQGYVFEEPWCSSSKGQPIYVVSNAKPNVCSSWLNSSLLYTNLPSLILAHPPPPPPLLAARTTHIHIHMLLLHHHNHLHARPKVPIQLLHQYWRVRETFTTERLVAARRGQSKEMRGWREWASERVEGKAERWGMAWVLSFDLSKGKIRFSIKCKGQFGN